MLIVPEQYSFAAEKEVLLTLGDVLSQNVTVLSFSRLCDEIERIKGGMSAKDVSDCDKIILMKKAVFLSRDRLTVFRPYADSYGFASKMADTVSEFKLNAVNSDDLIDAAGKTDLKSLSDKLMDTAAVFEAYDAVLGERFTDPSDRLTKLYYALENCDYFCGRDVFIDSFKGFTGQQFKIIDRILASCKSLTVSLMNDTENANEYGIFSNINKTAGRIKKLAQMHNVPCDAPINLTECRYNNEGMKNLERLMSGNKPEGKAEDGSVILCAAQNTYDECEYIARSIRKTVRSEGARYRDFVVVTRDSERYFDPLTLACRRNGVPLFFDEKIPMSSMPVCVAVNSAVDAIFDFSSENILRFHKSGIKLIDEEDLAALENYTYIWNISGKKWLEEWDMNPNGLTDRVTDESKEKLKKLNLLRKTAIKPLLDLKDDFNGSAEDMARAVAVMLENVKMADSLKDFYDYYKAGGNLVLADAVRQSWDTFTGILESVAICLEGDTVERKEFCDILKTAVNMSSIGVTPQMTDEVTFGDAVRIRPSRPKYVYILGANQGVFPKTDTESGIFSGGERLKLIDLDIDIPDKTVGSAVDEDFLVYSSVCCASDRAVISYLDTGDGGTLTAPSAFVTEIRDNLSPKTERAFDMLSEDNLPETTSSAVFELCKRLSDGGSDPETLKAALYDSGDDAAKSAERVLSGIAMPENRLNPETAKRLFGTVFKMSPTKFEKLSHCRFNYFCRYGLGIDKLQPVDFNKAQSGTFIHHILETVVLKYKSALKDLTDQQMADEVNRIADEYLDGIEGYRGVEDTYLKYLVSCIKTGALDVVKRMSNEFKHCEFEPVRCELKIHEGGEVEPVRFPLDNGGVMLLEGTVDRIDEWNGYLRVIDYKSGSKTFQLSDVLMGQNMQLLIYLYTVLKSGKLGNKSAGVFYYPAKRVFQKKDRVMSGIAVNNEDVLYAMESRDKKELVYTSRAPSKLVNEGDFEKIFGYLEKKIPTGANAVSKGEISPAPIDCDKKSPCDYCLYAGICRMKNKKHQIAQKISDNSEVIIKMKEQVENGEV